MMSNQYLTWPCAYCGKPLNEITSSLLKRFCNKCKVLREKERNKNKYKNRKLRNGKPCSICIVCGHTIVKGHVYRYCSKKCRLWKYKEKLLLEQLERFRAL